MTRIEPICCMKRLMRPKRPSEEQVRYRLAQKIEAAGFYPALEVPIRAGYLDIVIFDRTGTTALAIVETKAAPIAEVHPKCRTLYASFGVPVYMVCGRDDIDKFVNEALPGIATEYVERYASQPRTVHHAVAKILRDKKEQLRTQRQLRKLRRADVIDQLNEQVVVRQ